MKMLRLLWLFPLGFVLSACPYESTVPMASGPREPIDSSLLGYWYGIVKDGSDFFGIEALDISRQTDSVYAITRYGKAVKGDIILPDTAYYTGFISYIGEQRFMNIEGSLVTVVPVRNKPPQIKTERVYYLSAINRNHDTLIVKTIMDKFSPTRRIVKSPEDLKSLVSESLESKRNIYDEQYSLSYRKMIKPGR